MSDIQDIAKAIAQATTNNTNNTTSTTNATVKRIEDGVAYVQFDGAETETPVQLTISANAGDTVKVTVSNGKAWIVGNTTAPPTDDSTAVQLFNELKAEKITADRIDVSDLFAQKIECKGTISGATLKGGTIEGTTVKAGTIEDTELKSAYIESSEIYGTQIQSSELISSSIRTATLKGGTIEGTNINGVNITGSTGLFTSGFDVDVPIKNGEVEAYNLRLGTHEDKYGSYIHLGTHGSDSDTDWLQYGVEIFPYADKGYTTIKGRDIYITADRQMNIEAPNGIYLSSKLTLKSFLDVDDYVSDTGWRYPTIASSFTATNNAPRARRIGKTVVFTGALNPSKKLSGSSDKVTICTLGDNYRPSNQINILCQGSGQNKWMLTIETTGTVSFSRYGTTAAYVDATTSTWLPFHTSWFVD